MTHPVQEEMDRLRAALELDREDAKRYRWLRDAIIEECVEAGSFAQAKGESVVKALRSLKEESRLKNRPPCLYCGGSIRFISAAAGSAPAPKYLCQQCGTAAGVKLAMPFSGSCKECGIDLSKLATLDCRHQACPAYTENALVTAVICCGEWASEAGRCRDCPDRTDGKC